MAKKEKKRDGLVFGLVAGLLGLFLFLTFAHRIFVVVPAGHSGVLWKLRGGTVTGESVSEGIQVLWPWNELAVYNTRLQSETREFHAQALGGLTLKVTVTFRYRPDPQKLALLHKYIGRDYLDTYLVPELGSLVARAIAKKDHESVYADRHTLAEELTLATTEGSALQTLIGSGQKERLVQVPEIFVNEVVLPADVNEAVKSKFAKIERLEAGEYDKQIVELESELLEKEGRGVAKFQALLGKGLGPYLTWKSIEATSDVAKSENSKIVIMGPGQDAPVMINNP